MPKGIGILHTTENPDRIRRQNLNHLPSHSVLICVGVCKGNDSYAVRSSRGEQEAKSVPARFSIQSKTSCIHRKGTDETASDNHSDRCR